MDESTKKQQDPDKNKKEKNELVISYLALRKYLGLLGIGLPIILLVGSCIVNDNFLESSISNYFHTPLRQFFTIRLGGISLLLFAYRGYDPVDRWVTNGAGVFGLLTSFVSTNFKDGSTLHGYLLVVKKTRDQIIPLENLNGKTYEIIPTHVSDFQATLHLVFAALFFLLLSYMAIFQFTKVKERTEEERKKIKKERLVYRICGWLMVATIVALIPVAFEDTSWEEYYTDHSLVFWGECICLWAFGISWLVKGISSEQRVLNEKQDEENEKKQAFGA